MIVDQMHRRLAGQQIQPSLTEAEVRAKLLELNPPGEMADQLPGDMDSAPGGFTVDTAQVSAGIAFLYKRSASGVSGWTNKGIKLLMRPGKSAAGRSWIPGGSGRCVYSCGEYGVRWELERVRRYAVDRFASGAYSEGRWCVEAAWYRRGVVQAAGPYCGAEGVGRHW